MVGRGAGGNRARRGESEQKEERGADALCGGREEGEKPERCRNRSRVLGPHKAGGPASRGECRENEEAWASRAEGPQVGDVRELGWQSTWHE